MKHFQYIGKVDTFPLLHEIQRHPELWNENDLRTAHPGSAHAQADDIWLWFNKVTDGSEYSVADDIQTYPYKAWSVLTHARTLVLDLMRRVDGTQLGRVLITRLVPGTAITPHTDQGAPATFYRRYQIALQSMPGAVFNIDDEQANFQTGDVWWINNRAEHSVVNNSADDRIVMIVDVRCDA